MSDNFLPFSRPTISAAALQEVQDCLTSGWLTTGPRTQRFENMLKDYLGAPHVMALTSGTAGLHLGLLGLKLKPDDEVIVPAMTFVGSLNTIVQSGGKPVAVDVELETYNIDPTKIEQAITPRTRAIMPVHLAGLSANLEALYAIAEKYHLRVIEDAAQAIGTTYQGKRIGSFGDTQVFSFHPNKNITTGEGGCVATRDDELAHTIRCLRFHGIDRDAFNRFSKAGTHHYDVIAPGFKYNMLDIQAALGIHQLPELAQFNLRRKQLAQAYYNAFCDWPEWILPPNPKHAAGHSWHLYAPLLNLEKARMTRDEFIFRMKQEHHIGIGVHYSTPPPLYTFYRETYGYKIGDFPNAEKIAECIMSLPLFPSMTDSDHARVIDATTTVLRGK